MAGISILSIVAFNRPLLDFMLCVSLHSFRDIIDCYESHQFALKISIRGILLAAESAFKTMQIFNANNKIRNKNIFKFLN